MDCMRFFFEDVKRIFKFKTYRGFVTIAGAIGASAVMMMSCSDDFPAPVIHPWDGEKNMEQSIKPGYNFYRFANGGWLQRTSLPDGWAEWGPWQITENDATGKLRMLYQSTSDDLIQRFTLMAQDKLNRSERSADALRPLLREINAITSRDRLVSAIAAMQKAGYTPFFEVAVVPHEFNSRIFLPELKVTSTHFPADFYDDNTFFVDYVQLLAHTFSELFSESGSEVANTLVRDALSVQMELATAQNNDLSQPVTVRSSILNLLEKCGINTTCVYHPSTNIDVANNLILEGDLKKLKHYLIIHLIEQNAYVVGLDIQQKWLDFEDTHQTGSLFYRHHKQYDVNTANAEDAWSFLNHYAPEFVGRHYARKYITTEKQNKMKSLFAYLSGAFKERVRDSIDWMGEETRRVALKKVEAINPLLLQPASWPKSCDVQLNADNFCVAVNLLRKHHYQNKLALLGMPIANRSWDYVLHAYPLFEPICKYEPRMNALIVTPAFAGEEFFDEHACSSQIYGSAGFRMAREMIHGFDANGSRYNHTGALADWWKLTDRTAFMNLRQTLANQYSDTELLPNVPINGEQVSDEAVADLGGLQIATQAFEIDLRRRGVSNSNVRKERSQFFVSFAQTLAKVTTDAYKLSYYQYAPVAFDEHRVLLTVSNTNRWYSAFSVNPNDKMYLLPSKRVCLW